MIYNSIISGSRVCLDRTCGWHHHYSHSRVSFASRRNGKMRFKCIFSTHYNVIKSCLVGEGGLNIRTWPKILRCGYAYFQECHISIFSVPFDTDKKLKTVLNERGRLDQLIIFKNSRYNRRIKVPNKFSWTFNSPTKIQMFGVLLENWKSELTIIL